MIDTYHPEQDSTPHYRALIGLVNWIITLGRFDIAYATSTLARYSMAPREGHLIALKQVFGYLTKFPHGELMINPRPFKHPPIKNLDIQWQEFYPDAKEELPPDRPEPLPTKAQITIYVDADHAHDTVMRRSVTDILVFIDQTLVRYISKCQKTVETSSYGSELVRSVTDILVFIDQTLVQYISKCQKTVETSSYGSELVRSVTDILVFIDQTLVRYISKCQKTVETSSYGSELVAARMATKLAMEYRYAVRMMGVEVNGPRCTCSATTILLSSTRLYLSSMLKKKHQSIAYHAVRQAQASRIISFKYVPSALNWADACTKPNPPGKLHELVAPLLFKRSGYPKKG